MNRSRRFAALLHPLAWLAGLLLSGFTPMARSATPVTSHPVDTLLVFDGSGSMRERIGGEAKIDIAKRAVRELVAGLPAGTRLGLVAYSHRRAQDCADIELLIPPGPLDPAAFVKAIDGLAPRGMTPISASLTFAAEALRFRTAPGTIILFSDGVETCGKDPCATVAELVQHAKALTIHTVAFDLSAKEAQQIACISSATGGRFLQASDAASLQDALEMAVAAAPRDAAPPPAEDLSAATLRAPASVVAGAVFSVEWTGPNNPDDYLTVAAAGMGDDVYANFSYTRRGSPLPLTAPLAPGTAEVRYVAGRSRQILGRTSVTITPAEVTLTAADEALAGSAVSITWSGPNNAGDYLTIVAAGAPDAHYAAYADASRGSPVSVAAPIELGTAEIRYVAGQGRKVLARRLLRVTAAAITLDAPAEVIAGSVVSIAWTGPNNAGDYLTVVPRTLPDSGYAGYRNTSTGSPLSVAVPIEPGEAEIRYVAGQGRKVLARRPLTVRAPTITLTPPAKAPAGSLVAIAWTGPDNAGDYLTIVPKGTPDTTWARYAYTRNGSPAKVAAPAAPGPVEVRYLSGQGNKVLARAEFVLE